MKQLQWSKLGVNQISNTLWKGLADKGKDGEERLRREKIDINELESLFTAVVPASSKAIENVLTSQESLTKGSTKKRQAVSILDGKTINNICINNQHYIN